jgi:hypothetical protein
MLQNLLAERFKLTLHRETKELPMYALVVGAKGPKLKDSTVTDTPPTIFSALQEQLGLKLEAKKGPVDLLVIDHVEKTPTAN